jgi:hypothetical protein
MGIISAAGVWRRAVGSFNSSGRTGFSQGYDLGPLDVVIKPGDFICIITTHLPQGRGHGSREDICMAWRTMV